MTTVSILLFTLAAIAVLVARTKKGISTAHLRALLAGGALVLDVRTPEEFADSHIEGAINIALQELEGHLDRLPKNRDIVLHCKGGSRSAQALKILKAAGFTKVADAGGIDRVRAAVAGR